ncbi:hypothetical protein PAMP_019171 [Pampus punctatissimus]
MRALDPIRSDPPLHPKPALPERLIGPLPPKPAVAAKPSLPTPTVPAGARPSSAPPSSCSSERVHLRAHTQDGRPADSLAQPNEQLLISIQNESQEGPRGAASAPSYRKELLPPALSPWRVPSTQDRSEKAQSVTDESLPKPRQHMKPLPQRRAVSVHEDTLAMTQELKAVLQRSPIRFRGNRGDLPTCTEDPTSGEEAQMTQEARETWKQTAEEKEQLKPGCGGMVDESRHPPPEGAEAPVSGCPSSAAQASASRLFSPAATLEKPVVTPTSQEKSPGTAPALAHLLEKTLVSPPPREKTPSTISSETLQRSQVSPLPHKKKSPGTSAATVDVGNSTQERGEVVSKQHTTKAEPADQRTEPPLSE